MHVYTCKSVCPFTLLCMLSSWTLSGLPLPLLSFLLLYRGGGGGGLHRGAGGRLPPPPPPNFRLQYKGVPKSPLLSLFCNSVYWLKPHNNVNSRPPKLAVLPPPCYIIVLTSPSHLFPHELIILHNNTLSRRTMTMRSNDTLVDTPFQLISGFFHVNQGVLCSEQGCVGGGGEATGLLNKGRGSSRLPV